MIRCNYRIKQLQVIFFLEGNPSILVKCNSNWFLKLFFPAGIAIPFPEFFPYRFIYQIPEFFSARVPGMGHSGIVASGLACDRPGSGAELPAGEPETAKSDPACQ